ncbi:MAG TPA: glycoside hydrolase family 3 N-terminal domain-containing protein [Candidatus Acidoferrales bacterium]|nr:glycoside hydrolase family 3 N-terminal domain-containing protein [Candidatus Acidoferrales bacterium]
MTAPLPDSSQSPESKNHRAARVLKFLAVVIAIFIVLGARQAAPDYRNPNLPIAKRVADLLSRMTLEEKVDQISGGRREGAFIDSTGRFTPEQARHAMREMFSNDNSLSPYDMAVLRNAAQRYAVEKMPHGIPILFMGEALHGFMENGSTSFPQCIGLASTWDPALIHQVFDAASDEMSASGTRQAFSPVVDLARDPRWGRTEETYGEDPYLVARMGVAVIEGLQGDPPSGPEASGLFPIGPHHILATAKHFVHGMMEGGRNTAPSNVSERELRESFFIPFRFAVEEARVGSVMASYNEIDGIPNHINHWLLDTVLRQEWGFPGYITSDGHALQMLYETHHVAAGPADAAREALAAGVDFDLSDGSVYQTLIAQVKAGKVPQSEVDQAAGRILAAKFRLGLFEHPYVDPAYAAKITDGPAHQKLAVKAAQESIVLLKNQGDLLPLDIKKLKTVAVIGPNAADTHLGGYSRQPSHTVSILDGIRERLAASGVNVLYAQGCKITDGIPGWRGWYENDVKVVDPRSQQDNIRAAASVARKADVAIVVIGGDETTTREAWSEQHLGDRSSLNLVGAQRQLVKAVFDTGTPTVVFLINGRPLSINWVAANIPAILEGWYLGGEGGTAAANVLFGDVDPGGKLPVTFPRSVGQLPDYYDHKPSRNRSYAFVDSSPLFPFGYGLSYTTFRFDNLRVSPAKMKPGDTATVSVDVTNTGGRQGDEVAELYIHQQLSTVTQPVMALRGFHRLSLQPGQKTTVEFKLKPDSLSIYDESMKWVVQPGIFDIMVGPSSANTQHAELEVTP